MSLHLTMPEELEARLRQKAALMGLSVEDLATGLLAAGISESVSHVSGNEVMASWRQEGLIGYRSDIADPVKHARKLRMVAERRRS